MNTELQEGAAIASAPKKLDYSLATAEERKAFVDSYNNPPQKIKKDNTR